MIVVVMCILGSGDEALKAATIILKPNSPFSLINDLDIKCFNFQRFGKEFAKQLKLSPNSFIQLAIQLAYYR